MKARLTLLLFLFLGMSVATWAQENDEYDEYSGEDDYYDESYDEYSDDYTDEAEDLSGDIMRKSEFAIPSSPAFSLLGVTPEMVTRPGSVQDFKVDWRLKNYNIALIWHWKLNHSGRFISTGRALIAIERPHHFLRPSLLLALPLEQLRWMD